ncbi:MAG: ROK family transcriptional regulator, partial [Bifidobacteriaceae bacterium]|nr:ROK family transcriptional regulator [Bifidobacteriaceae bacterium]
MSNMSTPAKTKPSAQALRPTPTKAPSGRITQAEAVRQHNLAQVLAIVANNHKPLSRADIAQLIGVSRATASALVDQLVEGNLLEELDAIRSGRAGRPATPVQVATHTVAGLGIQVDVDYLAVRALDLAGNVLADWLEPIDLTGSDPVQVLAQLGQQTNQIAEQLISQSVRLTGAVLALPGIADSPLGPLRLAPNLRWSNVDAATLINLTACQLLRIDNEATLAARAELAAWASQPSTTPAEQTQRPRSFLYLSVGFGIGGAAILDGRTFPGNQGWAGEIGHVTVDPQGDACTCGSSGCLEVLAGRRTLMQIAGLDPSEPAEHLAQAAARGDAPALAALAQAGWALGVALGSAFNLLDLPAAVIGGFPAPLMPQLGPLIAAELKHRAMASRLVGKAPEILSPLGGPQSATTGA